MLCEDTRRTRILLDARTASARELSSYHEHNEAARTAEVLPRLEAGETVALVSDAGLPGVNDPGARLIAAALEAGMPVTVLPGPSAVETALVASGFGCERYQFRRLPAARGRRRSRRLWERARRLAVRGGRVRVAATASGVARVARRRLPERPVAVCRELTKQFEEVVRGPARDVAAPFADAAEGRDHARARRWRRREGSRTRPARQSRRRRARRRRASRRQAADSSLG